MDDARLLSAQRLQAIRYQAMADACDSRMNGVFRRKAEEQCLLLGHIDAQAERIRGLEAGLDAYNRRWKLLQEKVNAYDEIAARELSNGAGYYFSECSKVLKEALEDAEQIMVEQ